MTGIAAGRARARRAFTGLGPFTVVWAGQLVTLLGTEIVKFAFILRAWTDSGQATRVVGLALALAVPRMLLSPFAGVLVDRWPKKAVLQVADLGGLAAMAGLTVVYFTGHVQLWHLYVALAVSGAAEAFQYPAFSSTIPLMVPPAQRQRAGGMLTTARSVAGIAGPATAGVLIAVANLGAVLLIDVSTFVVAIVTILVVSIPEPAGGPGAVAREEAESQEPSGLWAEAVAGIHRIRSSRSLTSLTVVFFTANLAAVFGFALLPTMVLARSGDDSAAWASVGVASGVGGVLGGVLLTAVRVPNRHRMTVLLAAMAGASLIGQIVMAVGRGVAVWCLAEFGSALLIPVVNDMLTLLLQSKVPAGMQGRVFGAIEFVADLATPVAMLVAAPLADHVFEPQARAGTGLPDLLAPLVGRGAGTGMAVMLFLAGIGTLAAAGAGFALRSLREIDALLPDLDQDFDQHVDQGSEDGRQNPDRSHPDHPDPDPDPDPDAASVPAQP